MALYVVVIDNDAIVISSLFIFVTSVISYVYSCSHPYPVLPLFLLWFLFMSHLLHVFLCLLLFYFQFPLFQHFYLFPSFHLYAVPFSNYNFCLTPTPSRLVIFLVHVFIIVFSLSIFAFKYTYTSLHKQWGPFVRRTSSTEAPYYVGFCIDLLDVVAERMNFRLVCLGCFIYMKKMQALLRARSFNEIIPIGSFIIILLNLFIEK